MDVKEDALVLLQERAGTEVKMADNRIRLVLSATDILAVIKGLIE